MFGCVYERHFMLCYFSKKKSPESLLDYDEDYRNEKVDANDSEKEIDRQRVGV